jgi:hypothetical protein
MGDSGPFALNEKVLVPHTDKFYEAKVLKAQKREDGLWYYLLHYTGMHGSGHCPASRRGLLAVDASICSGFTVHRLGSQDSSVRVAMHGLCMLASCCSICAAGVQSHAENADCYSQPLFTAKTRWCCCSLQAGTRSGMSGLRRPACAGYPHPAAPRHSPQQHRHQQQQQTQQDPATAAQRQQQQLLVMLLQQVLVERVGPWQGLQEQQRQQRRQLLQGSWARMG